MATKIGSLFYEIFADSSKLNKGLTDSKTAMGQFSDKFKKVTGISIDAAGAFMLAATAVKKFIDYVRSSVDATDAYVSSMTDMSRMTGINIEDMSRLAQAADDLFISQEQLNTALTAAGRKGIDTSIEGLKDLSRQYLSLGTAAEKAKFLTENFGRSGMAMGKLLEVGADGIDAATAAIADNLVVTKEAQQVTYAYKRSVDAVEDSVKGMAYTMGQDAMPILTDFNIVLAYITDQASKADVNLFKLGTTALTGLGFNLLSELVSKFADKIMALNPDLLANVEATNGLASANSDVYTSYQDLLPTVEQFMDLQGKSADAVEEATRRIVLSLLEERLAADGKLDEKETAYLLSLGEQWGIYSEAAIASSNAVLSEVDALISAFGNIPSQITTTIKTVYKTEGSPSKHASTDSYWQDAMSGPVIPGANGASGLDMVVPPGYPNDSFLIAASSGENVDIGRGDSGGSPEVKEFMAMLTTLPDQIARSVRDAVIQGNA
jgi:hypothetical protein